MTEHSDMASATKDLDGCVKSREYCGLGARSIGPGGTADMYSMKHNPRCKCLCPTHPLFSSLWPFVDQPLGTVVPKWHHHRLFALSANFNAQEQWWKSFEILEYKPASKTWVPVATMPDSYVHGLFQVISFDHVRAASHESRIIISHLGDGQINGAVYDLDTNTWSTDWRIPVHAAAWFRGAYPLPEICVPCEKYMLTCHTHAAVPEVYVG